MRRGRPGLVVPESGRRVVSYPDNRRLEEIDRFVSSFSYKSQLPLPEILKDERGDISRLAERGEKGVSLSSRSADVVRLSDAISKRVILSRLDIFPSRVFIRLKDTALLDEGRLKSEKK